MSISQTAQANVELQVKLLGLFQRLSSASVDEMFTLLPEYKKDEILAGVAQLFGASKLEPENATSLGFAGVLHCKFRPATTP